MTMQHRELAAGRWLQLTFFEQMANIGSEIERTISWKKRSNPDYSNKAFERGLELIDLTIRDGKNRSRLRELTRVREILCDHFAFSNQYRSTDESWQKYFYAFTFAACRNR
jgi:hypothetical protein